MKKIDLLIVKKKLMVTLEELDKCLLFLPEEIVKIIFNYSCKDCLIKNSLCEECWYNLWREHFDD